MKTLILGGARSGKSRLAEAQACEAHCDVTYVATATPGDSEMAARIAHHRLRRTEEWRVVEEPVALAATLTAHAAPDACVLVDCLTLWLSNLLTMPRATFTRERDALIDGLPGLPGEILLVSNETGLGVVPMGALTRRYCDEVGRLHQELAAICDRVIFMVASLPLYLKGAPR